jgi:hypothetical protein
MNTDHNNARDDAAIVGALFLLALVLRVLAAYVLGPHVDEAESVLAARIVARDGVPLLPSGVLFLQGATLSVLLQPLLSWSPDPLALFPLRLPSALAGALAVPVLHALALALGAHRRTALFAGFALALDPASIEWSAHVRPYALLQLVSVGAILLWLRALDRSGWRWSAALATTLAFGVFTHIGVLLLVPPMVLLTWARGGPRARAPMVALLSIAVPFAVFLAMNMAFSVTTKGAATGPSFIGDHLLDLRRLLSPQLDAWRWLFPRSATRELLPPLLGAAAGVLVARRVLAPHPSRFGTLVTLALYTFPVVVVSCFTSDAQPRYLLHVQPLTWLLVGQALEELLRVRVPAAERIAARTLALSALVIVSAHLFDGLYARFARPEVDPSYQAALTWVAARQQTGEPVLSAMTAVAWLAPVPLADVRFLAGPEGGERALRYTRPGPDDARVDYWAGVPAVASTRALCAILDAHPGAWMVADAERLGAEWAFAGSFAKVILGSSELVYVGTDGGRVYRSHPRAAWTPSALAACEG